MDARALADEDLIPLMARGDARAFEAIYERHSGAAYSLAYRMVGARAAAEDVVQEAFLNLWRSGDDETAAERLEAPDKVEEDVARRDEAAIVRNAMEILPSDQLKVIELAYFGGFTHVEIAEMLEQPIGTVKGRMRLGLKKMREALAQGAVG